MSQLALPVPGVLVISIDLELDPRCNDGLHQELLDKTCNELLKAFSHYEVPATWAVADPAFSAATDRVLGAGQGHEIAVLGDPTWVGRDAGRGRFARELSRRVLRARQFGLPVTTLALRDVVLEDHLDLLAKLSMTAVRSDSRIASSVGAGLPKRLHHHLHQFATSVRLPGDARWFQWSHSLKLAKRSLKRLASDAGPLHIALDAPALSESPASGRRTIDRLLGKIDQLRGRQLLAVETLAQLAARINARSPSVPARSILHRAA